MFTKDLNSFLANMSDASLVDAAFKSNQLVEAEIIVEKLNVRNHEVEWFEEDHDPNFSKEFSSEFASSLRRESVLNQPSQDHISKIHNETVKALINKFDDLVIQTNKIILAAEKEKGVLRKYVKNLKIQLSEELKNKEEAIKLIEQTADEVTNLKVRLQVEKDLVVALKFKLEDKKQQSEDKRTKETEPEVVIINHEERPLSIKDSSCNKCNYFTRNQVLMTEHKEKRHSDMKCLMCGDIFPNMKTLKTHKEKHNAELNVINKLKQYPANVYSFKCTPCKVSFNSQDDLMDHMFNEHLTEDQRQGKVVKKFQNSASEYDSRPPVCKNGEKCFYHKQNRCNFFHALPPQQEQRVQPSQQSTSRQWHTVQRRRPGPTQASRFQQQGQGGQQLQQQQGGEGQHQQRYGSPTKEEHGGQQQQSHGAHQQQGHGAQQQQRHGGQQQQRGVGQQRPGQQEQRWKNYGGSRETSTPLCRHVHNCLQGRFCVLRNEGEKDFTSQHRQGRQ